jgi:hypothetical protein
MGKFEKLLCGERQTVEKCGEMRYNTFRLFLDLYKGLM